MAYQTCTLWGRDITDVERADIRAQAEQCVSEGKLRFSAAKLTQGGWLRTWQTEADATAWQTFINTFTPPPVSCTVTAV